MPAEKSHDESAAPLTEHLAELRKRLIVCCWAIGGSFLICYAFSEQLFHLLMLPLVEVLPDRSSMIFTGLAEGFFTYLKVGFIAGVLLASPVIFYQLWAFISPGLYSHEKKYVVPFAFFSALFFVGGALFGYFFVFPIAFKYFMSFNTAEIRVFPSMREYLSFATTLLIAFGVSFELPVFVVLLARLGLVTIEGLTKNRKYVIVGIFIVAAILTPPDVVSQVLMAIPMLLLYELGVIGARLTAKKKPKKAKNGESGKTTEKGAPTHG